MRKWRLWEVRSFAGGYPVSWWWSQAAWPQRPWRCPSQDTVALRSKGAPHNRWGLFVPRHTGTYKHMLLSKTHSLVLHIAPACTHVVVPAPRSPHLPSPLFGQQRSICGMRVHCFLSLPMTAAPMRAQRWGWWPGALTPLLSLHHPSSSSQHSPFLSPDMPRI